MKQSILGPLVLLLVLGLGALGCNLFGNDESVDADDLRETALPVVQESGPADGATQVDRNPEIMITFSEAMDEASVEAATGFGFDMISIPFETSWRGNVYTIIPSEQLAYNTTYMVYIGGSARSEAGEPMGSSWTLFFTTVTEYPVVVETHPSDGALDVPLNADPWIRFNQAMDPVSTEATIAIDPAVDFVFHWEEPAQVRLDVLDELDPVTNYDLSVAASAATANEEFTLLEDYDFSFTTGTAGDQEAPSIVAWDPSSGSLNVPRDLEIITVTFSEPVNPATVLPTLIDMRLLMAVGFQEVTWNADFSVMSYELGTLPAGAELFVDLGPFEDMEGNASEDPERWWFETDGEADWFPNEEQDQWQGLRRESIDRCEAYLYPFTRQVENSNGPDFDINQYRCDRNEPSLDESWHFTKLIDRVESRGPGYNIWSEELEDYVWVDQWITPPMDWLLLPPGEEQSWSGQRTIEIGGDLGSGTLYYVAEVLGFEDLALEFHGPRAARGGEGEDEPLNVLLPRCALVKIVQEIDVEFEVGPEVWEPFTVRRTEDNLWYCSGVGLVQGRREFRDQLPGDQAVEGWYEDEILMWSVGQ